MRRPVRTRCCVPPRLDVVVSAAGVDQGEQALRWVTYLSPSGGAERVGVLDDGDVLGSADPRDLGTLLAAGDQEVERVYRQAVDEPVEIIMEPEARVCAPTSPTAPVPVRTDGSSGKIAPELIVGVDDTVPSTARTARIGVAALTGADGAACAYTPACLWLDADEAPVRLSLGPVVTTADAVPERPLGLSASSEDRELTRGLVLCDHEWLHDGPGQIRALLTVVTPPLEEGDELFVEVEELGSFEVRIGSRV